MHSGDFYTVVSAGSVEVVSVGADVSSVAGSVVGGGVVGSVGAGGVVACAAGVVSEGVVASSFFSSSPAGTVTPLI